VLSIAMFYLMLLRVYDREVYWVPSFFIIYVNNAIEVCCESGENAIFVAGQVNNICALMYTDNVTS
jgi:hypothetical protein